MMMDVSFSDIVGVIGVTIITGSYAWLQINREFAHTIRYPLFNMAGALMIIYSLMYDWNLSAFMVEAVWVIVSMFGLYNSLRQRARQRQAARIRA